MFAKMQNNSQGGYKLFFKDIFNNILYYAIISFISNNSNGATCIIIYQYYSFCVVDYSLYYNTSCGLIYFRLGTNPSLRVKMFASRFQITCTQQCKLYYIISFPLKRIKRFSGPKYKNTIRRVLQLCLQPFPYDTG